MPGALILASYLKGIKIIHEPVQALDGSGTQPEFSRQILYAGLFCHNINFD